MLSKRSLPINQQFIWVIVTVLLVSCLCFWIGDELNFRAVALILLLMVSVMAMLFDILPVLLAAFLSAIIWNFFFIPPIFNFQIHSTEDTLMFLSYFFVALLNAVLTSKINQVKNEVRDKEEKEKTIVLYDTLINSLSHELKTPIATILGTVDTLKENTNLLAKEQKLDLLNDIEIASVRLNRLVNNILNINKLENGVLQPKLDWCDMNELINQVIFKLSPIQQTIDYQQNENLPYFKLDIGFMDQILSNILQNAVFYTDSKATIKIEVMDENDHCKITISDNGPGISEDKINQIFDKFYRLPNSKAGGIGLGLSIVKGFVTAQNGSVTVSNNTPSGLIFTLNIPAEISYLNNLKNE